MALNTFKSDATALWTVNGDISLSLSFLDSSQFSLIIRSLFESFNNSVSSVGSAEQFSQSVLAWLQQYCSLVALRPGLYIVHPKNVALGYDVVAQRHIFGVHTEGAMTSKFKLGRDFCTMHLPQVSSCYVYSFGSYPVDKQTHRRC